MGAGSSKQQIGERMKAARRRMAENEKMEDSRFSALSTKSPETLQDVVESVKRSLSSFAPFPEAALLLAFRADPDALTSALKESTRSVLTAPIQQDRYQWFMRYVFPSTVWFKETADGQYLYEAMMSVTDGMQQKIVQNMDSVFEHLQRHSKWDEITSIENETLIDRQDHDKVGLLQEAGIRDILEIKDDDDGDDGDGDDVEDLKNFIDNNLAINVLMSTAKSIDHEFQREMGTILSRHGEFKSGPMKKVERALSKMENDYAAESYPKSAKLLDIVRCSVSYNTADQLLDGFREFRNHIESGASSMELARIKNGFLDEQDGGYRDIKVNVVYHSTVHRGLKMVCEVQFILNQYLFEKKKVHKLYSIFREKTFFEMVVREDDVEKGKDLKDLQFEPVLNVRDDVELSSDSNYMYKSSIDSDLNLLAMNGGSNVTNPDKLFCVDMTTNEVIFEHEACGRYTHHWITIDDQKCLSLQTTPNTISVFKVSNEDHKFVEDESMRIVLDDEDVINFCEYDQSFDHIFTVRNSSILEKRAMKDVNTVSMSIELENHIGDSVSKLLSLSRDGRYCVIGGAGNMAGSGKKRNFFYLIDLSTEIQTKLISDKLTNTLAPCFVDGDSEFVAIGGTKGEGVEIWSVVDKQMVRHIAPGDDAFVSCTYSANGILAVGFCSRSNGVYLQLYDVRSWQTIYHQTYEMTPRSLFLTADSKYLAAGGGSWRNSERCIILKIS